MPDSGPAILIAAISGRALAASARRGGYLPLVTDFFGDQDTLAAAYAHVRLAGDLARGIEEQDLLRVLEMLSEQRPPAGIVYGTGFEMRTHLLDRLAQRWRLFGNNAETVAKVKNPEQLAATCAGLGIPCPDLSLSPPPSPADWLVKRRGGAGGGHVKPALHPHSAGGGMYYQRKMSGTPIAALFVSDGKHAVVLGFSAQWSSPTSRQPYRYGGAVRPATVTPAVADLLDAAVHKLAAAFSLVGLNSADFLVDGESIWLLEINPRPGATLDIFEPRGGSLFALHMAACRGKLFAAPHHPEGAKASAIVYAKNDIPCVPALDWPDWSADRPAAGITIKAGEPVCTVYACSQDVCSQAAAAARAIVDQRREMILAWTRAGGNHEGPAPDQCE